LRTCCFDLEISAEIRALARKEYSLFSYFSSVMQKGAIFLVADFSHFIKHKENNREGMPTIAVLCGGRMPHIAPQENYFVFYKVLSGN